MNQQQKLKDKLLEILKESQNEILEKGGYIISKNAYDAFRKLILDSFGHRGIRKRIDQIFDEGY